MLVADPVKGETGLQVKDPCGQTHGFVLENESVFAHPAFELEFRDIRDERNAVYVFRVDAEALGLQPFQARLNVTTMVALAEAFGLRSAEAVAEVIDADGVIVSSDTATNAGRGGR